jgi:transcriptional regulator with XRE-family HTH domain
MVEKPWDWRYPQVLPIPLAIIRLIVSVASGKATFVVGWIIPTALSCCQLHFWVDMTLAEFVTSEMEVRKLTAAEVARRSEGGISANAVIKIKKGYTKNPSIPILQALALGAGIDENQLLSVAGVKLETPENPWPPQTLIRALQRITSNDDFTVIVKQLMVLSDRELVTARRLLDRSKSSPNKASSTGKR